MSKVESLCKHCKHRFRRIYIPLRPHNYINEDGEEFTSNGGDNIIIMVTCLISGIEIESEDTLECSHFEEVKKKEKLRKKESNIFKQLT